MVAQADQLCSHGCCTLPQLALLNLHTLTGIVNQKEILKVCQPMQGTYKACPDLVLNTNLHSHCRHQVTALVMLVIATMLNTEVHV